MDAKNYLDKYIIVLILVTIVSATAGTLLTSFTALNTTFTSSTLGILFGTTIMGTLFIVWIFYSVYKHMKH